MDRFSDNRDYADLARQRAKAGVAGFDLLPDSALVDARYLAILLDYGLSTVWRKAATEPNFPARVKVNQGCTRFSVGDIRRYLSELPRRKGRKPLAQPHHEIRQPRSASDFDVSA